MRLRRLVERIEAADQRHKRLVEDRNAAWSALNADGVSAAELGRVSGVTRMAVVLAVQKHRSGSNGNASQG